MRLRTRELAQVNEQLQAENVARTAAELQLREADRRKDEFLATLAHELRHPLAPIRQAINVLAKSSDPAKQQKAREIVDRQAQRMALLLDDLLDDSRITRGRLILRKEPVSLAALIGSAVETVAGAVEERGHTLTIDLPAEPIEVEVDPLRLSQAVSNLLTNAVKYSPPGGKITLAVARRADQLLIRVGDTGVGFEPDKAASLFEMFSQSTPPQERADEGLGIGLALVKGLAELHGGSVHAQSRGKGLGAEFTLALPASAILQSRGEGRAESSPPAPAPSRPALILIAADNRDAAETMGSLLELAGHRVLIAHSGAQALSIGEQIKPDAVILDIGMPDMNGYEVARAIRAKAWGRGVSIIAVTGWGQPADKASAHEAGFQSASDQARDSAGDRRGDCGVPRATRFDRFAHHEHLIRNEPALERGCACVHGRP